MRSSILFALLSLLSLPALTIASSENSVLSVKNVQVSKRGEPGALEKKAGSYVSNYGQCLDVCNSYFGTPASSQSSSSSSSTTTSIVNNNNVVKPSTTRATGTTSSIKPSSITTPRSTPRPSSTNTTTTTATPKPSSSVISSATSIPPSSTTTSAPGSTGTPPVTADQQTKILGLHNTERAKFGASALTWNSTLATYAQTYASKCQWSHSKGPYGENLAASYGYADPIGQGIGGWNAEQPSYDYNNPTYSHWTQVVWKGTSQVGCALVKCPAGFIQPGWGITDYLVCEYYKPGNVIGQFPANVGRAV